MKIASFLLLLAGWFLVLAAIVLLPTPGTREGFIFSGTAVEALGLALAVRSHSTTRGARG
jgi:hypothetical protein